MQKKAFVTVGTTRFDALVDALNDPSALAALRRAGFGQLKVQIGHGEIMPMGKATGLEVTHYRFKASLDEDMDEADLIISHAGAGSIMESVRRGKRLIVVVNEDLMDNHQEELAEAMQRRGCLKFTYCRSLAQALEEHAEMDVGKFPDPDYSTFPKLLDREMYA